VSTAASPESDTVSIMHLKSIVLLIALGMHRSVTVPTHSAPRSSLCPAAFVLRLCSAAVDADQLAVRYQHRYAFPSSVLRRHDLDQVSVKGRGSIMKVT